MRVGVGTDISVAALAVAARQCAAARALRDRAQFVACDFGAALAGGFDLVVSNPPYIASRRYRRARRPRCATTIRGLRSTAAPTALLAYRAHRADAGRLLGRHGHLVVELGVGAGACGRAVFRRGLASLRRPLRPRRSSARPAYPPCRIGVQHVCRRGKKGLGIWDGEPLGSRSRTPEARVFSPLMRPGAWLRVARGTSEARRYSSEPLVRRLGDKASPLSARRVKGPDRGA